MNRIIIVAVLVIASLPVMSKTEQIAVNFTTNLYTESPIKKVNSLVMKLWSHVNVAVTDEEHYLKFLTMHEQFAKELLLLNSLLDNAFMVIEHQAYDCPECVEHAVHDLAYSLKVLESLYEQYNSIIHNQENEVWIITMYLLNNIMQKIKEVIKTGHVITPLHAFINSCNSSLSILSFKIS